MSIGIDEINKMVALCSMPTINSINVREFLYA